MHQKLSTALDIAERFLNLIRPRFYNRLTWIVVGAGLLLTMTPWWGDLVNVLAQKYLAVSLPAATEHTLLGVGLVAIGLIYHIAAHSIYELVASRREAAELGARGDHDRKIFLRLQEVAPERQLLGILQDIATLHHSWSTYGTQISGAIEYLRAPSNQFLADDITSAAKNLSLNLSKLRNFMGLNFFEHMSPPDGDMRFCLFPEGNIDRSRGMPSAESSRRYDELADELERHVSEAEESYAKFRSKVKQHLAI
jgi:hypothetical protein